MITDWLTSLPEAGSAIYSTAASASAWTLLGAGLALPFVALTILHVYRNIARNVEAFYRTAVYRLSESLAGWKTWFVVRFGRVLARRRSAVVDPAPQVEFDDLDIAVMKIAATLGPGFEINARQLAERFRMRPAQVQQSLEKLTSNKMMDNVIVSGEGFDSYRLTQLGNAFMATWAKRASSA